MKNIYSLITTLCLLAVFGCVSLIPSQTAAAPDNTSKRAILVVSFGTTYPETMKATIEAIENKMAAEFPDYEIRRAFTSRIIIKKLAERDGVKIDTEVEALAKLKAEGFSEVIVQPLHISAGEEFDMVKDVVKRLEAANAFGNIVLGRPILYYMGQAGKTDDYLAAAKALELQYPKLKKNEAIVLMGHGGVHPGNSSYAAMQQRLSDAGYKNVYVYTVEGYPSLNGVITKLKADKVKKVTLMPFMLVAGDHAANDMAGDEKDSAKNVLLAAGFKVNTYLHGMGENVNIQEIYVQHTKDAIAELNNPKTKKH
ncbi:Sirohydrochlorin cobaltochelatase [Sporomusa silvacetica DSM 10669]|uniref:Sirohydrochlorin cobaltochelatase n=1 Tax=Sporomusa silvacetica DSM 10669 TaxID=1123289 RepID=A0ABZ3IGB5_9FIRM|nr:sirohydrochlorin cobaltochelatase [Sporomusa silvacetica]OZC16904.1 sirohydrochlorin cobaltochelatase [Sporomusa silvacetica DSM 10669]